LRAHLNGGRLGNVRILKPASQAQLWEPLNWMDEWTAYGWGWELWEWAGWPVASMFGGQPGTQTGYAAVRCGKGQGLMVMGNLDTLETPWYAGDFMFGTGGSVAAIDELVCATCGCPPAAAGATGVRRPVGQYARKPAAMGPDGHAVYLPVVEKQ
jgi:hypothetical protein